MMREMRPFLITLVLAASVASSACAASSSSSSSGVAGTVLRGPTQPVCRVGERCEAPARVWLVFSRAGKEAGRVRTGSDGRFRLSLPSGAYAVRTTERVFGRIPQPSRLTVPRGRYIRVTLRIDTGIR